MQLKDKSPRMDTISGGNNVRPLSLPVPTKNDAQSMNPSYSENESTAGVESESKIAHEKFCQLLATLKVNCKGLFDILKGNVVVQSESLVEKGSSKEVVEFVRKSLVSSKATAAEENGASKVGLRDDIRLDGGLGLKARNNEDSAIGDFGRSDDIVVHSYFVAYGTVKGSNSALFHLRPIVIDGDSCDRPMEILCCIRFFLKQHRCVVLLLSVKVFAKFCKCSCQWNECLQWLRRAGIVVVIPTEPTNGESADLNIESAYVEDLLRLAYLTGSAILSNRKLISSFSNLAEWKRLAVLRLLQFSVGNEHTVKLVIPAEHRHGCTSLRWFLEFPKKCHVKFGVRPFSKKAWDELLNRLDALSSSLENSPMRIRRTLLCA
uniref:RNase NYN domain-containing protein n=1 Tax=Trichuris muris TaxID=70415 RepID=A0A5S6QL54_TRIMR